MKVLGYVRVSSFNQKLKNNSIPLQKKKIKEYCKLNDYDLEEVYEDDGISGMSIDKRNGYKKMIDFIKENEIDGIVVWSLSRLGRRMKDVVELMDYLKTNDIKLWSIKENLSNDDKIGSLIMNILGSINEFEVEVIRERIKDIKQNKKGHQFGISACQYFRDLLNGKEIDKDSLIPNYFILTRDFVSIQNVAGYETLKSQGLELIKNDSLRLQIISLYEYNYNTLRKLEEEYSEMQFQESYFKEINNELAPNFNFDNNGKISGITFPLKITEDKKKILLTYLWKTEINRNFILDYYREIENKIIRIQEQISAEKR